VDVTRLRPDALAVEFEVTGTIAELRMPPPAAATRADELWRRTCFEAFVRAIPGEGYCEFNLAPSTQWAAYGFSGYRRDMSVLLQMTAPRIEIRSEAGRFRLRTLLELRSAPGLDPAAVWRIGLSAVIEETSGRKSYWALAHPPGDADFHHSDCFAAELPPA
jgi:hypothetical protein